MRRYRFIAASFVAAALAALCVGTAFAALPTPELKPQKHGQVWTEDQLFEKNAEGLGGGVGILYGEFPFRREQALQPDAIKEIGIATLKKGAYVGLHQHKDNEDAYIMVEGKGIFTDGNGNAWVIRPGDITIARPSQWHGLANLYDDDIVFVYVISKNDAADLGYMMQYPTCQCFLAMTQVQRFTPVKGGTLEGRYAFAADQANENQSTKEIAIMSLPAGASLGKETQRDTEVMYLVISGRGVFTDTNGKMVNVGPRSVMVTGPGQSADLKNTGSEPLSYIKLIAKNSGAKSAKKK